VEIKIEIKNLPQVQAALRQSPQIVSKHINEAIKQSLLIDIWNKTKDLTPVDTGYLRGHWEHTMSNLRGELWPIAEYAIYVEMREVRHRVGTSHFLKKSVDQSSDSINKRFQEGLKNALGEIAQQAG